MTVTRKTRVLMSLALSAALVLSAAASLHPAKAQSKDITIWTKFNDQAPQNTQDTWLKETIAAYKTEQGGTITNVNVAFDQINAKLNVAVQAKGDVPDISYVDSQQLGFFVQNGTLTDLTDYVKGASWFNDIDPKALAACTAPDGKMLCVPSTTANHFMYYWKDYYPDGVPQATDKFLEAATKLKADRPDKFPFTGKLAEKISVERFYYGLILSFGGNIADADGKATWANDATVKVVEFARALFANKYATQESLAPAFDNEEPFKRGDAGTFVAGSYSYVYLTPLTSPKGTKYEGQITGAFDPKALSVGAALEAGELGIAPPFSAPGSKPYSLLLASAWAIPNGSKNIDGARAFIDYMMQTKNHVAFAAAYGALPTLKSAAQADEFKTPYWTEVARLQTEYGVGSPTLTDYDKGIQLLGDAIVKLITDQTLDIMQELQAAQEEYNAGL